MMVKNAFVFKFLLIQALLVAFRVEAGEWISCDTVTGEHTCTLTDPNDDSCVVEAQCPQGKQATVLYPSSDNARYTSQCSHKITIDTRHGQCIFRKRPDYSEDHHDTFRLQTKCCIWQGSFRDAFSEQEARPIEDCVRERNQKLECTSDGSQCNVDAQCPDGYSILTSFGSIIATDGNRDPTGKLTTLGVELEGCKEVRDFGASHQSSVRCSARSQTSNVDLFFGVKVEALCCPE